MLRFSLPMAVILFSHAALAQSSGGSLSGTVTDPSGAVLAGADVSIEKLDTHETRRIASSSSGLYSAPNLTPGAYRLTVSKPGFSTLTRAGIEIEVGASLVVDVPMTIGASEQKVEVTGEASVIEAASSSIGAVNSGQTIRELPLNGRDWTSLAALQPGVTVIRTEAAVGAGLANTRGNRGLGTMMSIDGSRPQQNNYRLDGVSLNDYAGSGPASVLGVSLGVDAIQEFSVVTGNAPADYA